MVLQTGRTAEAEEQRAKMKQKMANTQRAWWMKVSIEKESGKRQAYRGLAEGRV